MTRVKVIRYVVGVVALVCLKIIWIFLAVATMTLMLTTTSLVAGSILAATKTDSSNKFKKSETNVTHIRGVKVLRIHTVPSKVAVGSTFNLRGIVLNNSTATITFANGTCTSPLSVTFNKNAMSVPQTATASCNAQQVTLKPGGQSPILSPNLSGLTYQASSPGMTNASVIFKYQAITPSKSSISDSITRNYTFNILPAGAPIPHHASSQNTQSTRGSNPGMLRPIP
jgi:hypothetical protein